MDTLVWSPRVGDDFPVGLCGWKAWMWKMYRFYLAYLTCNFFLGSSLVWLSNTILGFWRSSSWEWSLSKDSIAFPVLPIFRNGVGSALKRAFMILCWLLQDLHGFGIWMMFQAMCCKAHILVVCTKHCPSRKSLGSTFSSNKDKISKSFTTCFDVVGESVWGCQLELAGALSWKAGRLRAAGVLPVPPGCVFFRVVGEQIRNGDVHHRDENAKMKPKPCDLWDKKEIGSSRCSCCVHGSFGPLPGWKSWIEA